MTDGFALVSDSVDVLVENTEPVISSVSISPATVYNDTTLTCSVADSDVDNQTLSTTYTWTNTSTGTILGSSSTLTLDATTASRNDVISCAVVVEDPDGGSDSASSSTTLSNREPSIASVSIRLKLPTPIQN